MRDSHGRRIQNATMFPSKDDDFYRFTLDSNQIVRVKIDSISSRLSDMKTFIYDEEEVQKESEKFRNVSSLDWGLSLKKGTYTLKISDVNNNYSTKPYSLIIASDTTDQTEWNNDTSSAANIEFGQPVKAAIYPSDDVDYFKFTLPTDDTVKISVDSISTALKHFRIYVLDSELNNVEYSYDSNITKFLSTGLYYIKIYDDNSASSFKRFMLTVTKTDTLSM